jgi:hypothetical protein
LSLYICVGSCHFVGVSHISPNALIEQILVAGPFLALHCLSECNDEDHTSEFALSPSLPYMKSMFHKMEREARASEIDRPLLHAVE